jgi:DNA invertase Pin-like site-specific DNA recombinase
MGNRPQFLAMMKAAQAGEVQAIVVIELTRLARSQSDLPKIIERLRFKGVRVIGVQDAFDTDSKNHKLQAGITGVIGESFREMISDRTRSALQMRATDKRVTGGRAYGFDSQRNQIPAQVKVVREIFRRFADGETMKAIATDLNEREVASPGADWQRKKRRKDGKWLVSALHAILHNELYIGRVIYNRREFRKDPDTGKRTCTERPRSEWIEHDDARLAIIDRQVFKRAQARFSQNVNRDGKRNVGVTRYALSGLLKCSECGSRFIVVGGNQGKHAYRYYVCGTNHGGGAHACSNARRVSIQTAEAVLIQGTIEGKLLAPATVRAITDWMQKQQRRAKVRGALPPAVIRLDEQIARIESLVRDGTLPQAAVAVSLDTLRAQRQGLMQDVAEGIGTRPATGEELAAGFTKQVKRLRSDLRSPEAATVREAVRSVTGDIVLRPAGEHLAAQFTGGELYMQLGSARLANGLVAGAGFGSIRKGELPTILLVKRGADE